MMILGMTESELQEFIERISATAIANQAILKCYLHEVPLTTDNVLRFVDDFVDPNNKECAGLIARIEIAIDEVVEKPWRVLGEYSPIN
jgi:hypothetical protein